LQAGLVSLPGDLPGRVLGLDHPDTLTTRTNIAAWTGDTGDATLLPETKRILGERTASQLGGQRMDRITDSERRCNPPVRNSRGSYRGADVGGTIT